MMEQIDFLSNIDNGEKWPLEGRAYGVLTNTGNLHDILSCGFVRPKSMRKKHYEDLGDFDPDRVVLVRLLVAEALAEEVTGEATHLQPVLLRLRDGVLDKSAVWPVREEDSASIPFEEVSGKDAFLAAPGPMPLTLFEKVEFARKTEREQYDSSKRYGEDDLGIIDKQRTIDFAAGDASLPAPRNGAATVDASALRLLDARAGVLAMMFADGMGGACRHYAVQALQLLQGGEARLTPALQSHVLDGVWAWIHQTPLEEQRDEVALLTQWLLQAFCEAGQSNGLPREQFLQNLQGQSDELPLEEKHRGVIRDKRLGQILDVVSFASDRTQLDVSKRPFSSLLEYLLQLEQYENEQYPDSTEHTVQLARIMHACRAGWKALDMRKLPVELRRAILHITGRAYHIDQDTGLRLEPASDMPTDHEGWLVAGDPDIKPFSKILQSDFFNPVWYTEVTLPAAAGPVQVMDGGRGVSFSGRIESQELEVQHQVDKNKLAELLHKTILPKNVRRACETAMRKAKADA